VKFDVDWSYGAEHMHAGHEVTVEEANEALIDSDALLFDPDPKSTSGSSARVIGYSPAATAVLVVILVHREDEPTAWWGANAWRANSRDETHLPRRDAVMNTDVKQSVARIAAEADASRDDPMSGDAVATKPNKSVTVATRLTPETVKRGRGTRRPAGRSRL
jgi:uncharacterized DUF497 family protein